MTHSLSKPTQHQSHRWPKSQMWKCCRNVVDQEAVGAVQRSRGAGQELAAKEQLAHCPAFQICLHRSLGILHIRCCCFIIHSARREFHLRISPACWTAAALQA